MQEAELQKEVIKFLKLIGCYTIKTVRSNVKGVPDIIGCIDGKFFAIELKATNKDFRNVTKLQKKNLEQINNTGGFGFYANNLKYIKDVFYLYLTPL